MAMRPGASGASVLYRTAMFMSPLAMDCTVIDSTDAKSFSTVNRRFTCASSRFLSVLVRADRAKVLITGGVSFGLGVARLTVDTGSPDLVAR